MFKLYWRYLTLKWLVLYRTIFSLTLYFGDKIYFMCRTPSLWPWRPTINITDLTGFVKNRDVQVLFLVSCISGQEIREVARVQIIMDWIRDNIKYKDDVGEYWQTPAETFDAESGDCEDMAILLYEMARNAGVVADNLRIVAAEMNDGGQHCFVTYLCPIKKYWIRLDPAMWPNVNISLMTDYNDDTTIKYVLFSFNENMAGWCDICGRDILWDRR